MRHGKYHFSDSAVEITPSGGAYTKITNPANTLWQTVESAYITFDGDSITIVTPGDYVIWFNLSGTGAGTNDIFKFHMFVDGVDIGTGGPKTKGVTCGANWVWYVEDLEVGSDISFRFTNIVDNGSLTVEDGAIYIRKEHH